jgi:hypothetical protein
MVSCFILFEKRGVKKEILCKAANDDVDFSNSLIFMTSLKNNPDWILDYLKDFLIMP